ncbi:MAG: DEAD/DEAH box helicase [Desulfobacterales bacterium]|nr:DEAD/DEAH box helicase [Desulfobacterales bacterium]
MPNSGPMHIRLSHHLRLRDVPKALYDTLVEKLTLANPKYLENARMGRWNRGVPKALKLFDRIPKGGLVIPRGTLRQLILLCRRLGIDYTIDDERRRLVEIDLNFKGTLKPFQQEAVAAMARRDFGTLSAPTGSGKTVMGLALIAARRQPALVVVHTRDLALQWMERMKSFLDVKDEAIGFIGGGKVRMGREVTVAMVQTLYKCADKVAPEVGFLVVDECHRCPSRLFTEAVTAFDSRYMLGLSATPWRRDKLSQLIFWHLGDVHHEISQERLVKTGDVLSADVIFRNTEFEPYFDPVNDYSRMLSELTADDHRNRLIAADVAQAAAEDGGGVCLVLSDRKKHCQALQALIRFKHGVDCDLLTGDLSNDQRKEVIERLHRGKVGVLVATGQLIGEGFDCPGLTTLFLATPIRFSGRVTQYLGRVLRPAPEKKKARVYDYVDVRVDVLVAAARSRQRVYGMGPA